MKNILLFSALLFCFKTMIGQPGSVCPTKNPGSVLSGEVIKETLPPFTTIAPPPPPPPALGDRIIYWVHGLGGTDQNWRKVGDVTEYQSAGNTVAGFPARKVESLYPDLGPDKQNWSLDAVGSTLRDFMNDEGEAANQANGITGAMKLNNFVIGHSQGGLSPRVLERRFVELGEERLFNGMVSFGSPHQGARILNNVSMIGQMAAEGCQALSAGPVAENATLKYFLKVFTEIDLPTFVNNACDKIGTDVLPAAFNDYTADITNDYYVGSPYITQLNQFPSTMHKIAFWGDETEEPVIWHTVSSRDPLGDLDDPNNFSVFEADDESLPAKAEEARLWYQSKVAEWEANSNAFLPWGVQCDTWYEWFSSASFCTLMEAIGVNADEAVEAYQQGLDWLSWEANDSYKVIIGAKVFDNPVITGGECWCTNYFGTSSNQFYEPAASNSAACSALTNYNNLFCSWQNIVSYLPLEKQSDGVVLAESAVNLPGATGLPVKMVGNNHMEMRNSEETRRVLLGLFSSGWGDPYFITQER